MNAKTSRRDVLKLMAGSAVAAMSPLEGGQSSKAALAAGRATVKEAPCGVLGHGPQRELISPTFTYKVDLSDGLTVESWLNRLTGSALRPGRHPEIELDLDASERRLFITGWRVRQVRASGAEPNRDEGYLKGFGSMWFDDADWPGRVAPLNAEVPLFRDYYWARTRVFLPPDAQGKELALVLGGVGLYDYRFMRVFVNGQEVGVREPHGRWHEPGVFDLGPASAVYAHLRFGQDNAIALQLSGPITRTARLDEVDPQRARPLASGYWPGQFEQYLVVGKPLRTPKLRVTGVETKGEGEAGELLVTLRGDEISVRVTYRWNGVEPVLHKSAEIQNAGSSEVRVMNVRLGTYSTGLAVSEGEQGFPVYIGDQFFASVAHPSGWAIGQAGEVRLKQYPGRKLRPGERLASMETVLGVAAVGEARRRFREHIVSRMRRVRRGHDKAYAILDAYGSNTSAWLPGDWPDAGYWAGTEDFHLRYIDEVVAPEQKAGVRYDVYTVSLWSDPRGDGERADPKRFPNGLENIRNKLEKLGIHLGLWTCTAEGRWSMGANPVVADDYAYERAYGNDEETLCLAAEPYKTMFTTAWRQHLRKNHLRLWRLDDNIAICYNPAHDHLPGLYSTEAIQSAFIDILRELDRECPELFVMLYWGARSPWWLLHADTLFESGLQIEAASPAASPALYARDSVTIGLDQAQWWAEDIPALGKDSLGVWLSKTPWNSGLGTERWQEGFVMDICRGSLLAQPWSDDGSLSALERAQLADFIALLKERPDCFGNPRLIIGNPWKHEPYGYACSNSQRAFLALNNYSWSDTSLTLQLDPHWGLPENGQWDLYRWYPDPARLTGEKPYFERATSISLRPYEVVLLEVVPAGTPPSLNRSFAGKPLPASFAEPSRELSLSVTPKTSGGLSVPLETEVKESDRATLPPKRSLTVQCQVPPSQNGGIVMIALEMWKGSLCAPMSGIGRHFAAQAMTDGKEVALQAVGPKESAAVPWQGWRIALSPSDRAQKLEVLISAMMAEEVETVCHGYFIPGR